MEVLTSVIADNGIPVRPVRSDPSPTKEDAVIIPVVFIDVVDVIPTSATIPPLGFTTTIVPLFATNDTEESPEPTLTVFAIILVKFP